MFTKVTWIKIGVYAFMAVLFIPISMCVLGVAALVGSILQMSWGVFIPALLLLVLWYFGSVEIGLYGDGYHHKYGLLNKPKTDPAA